MSTLIATPSQALVIWSLSWMQLYMSYYAFRIGSMDLSISTCCLFLTSILYWSNPRNNWIRIMDIITSLYTILLHAEKSFLVQYGRYKWHLLLSLLWYPLGWVMYWKKRYWLAIGCHAMMHSCGTISNYKMYQFIESKTHRLM